MSGAHKLSYQSIAFSFSNCNSRSYPNPPIDQSQPSLFRFLSHQGGNDSYRGKAASNSKSNLATFHLLQYGKQSSHKVITWKRIALTKHWVLNRIAPPSSITIGLIMLYLLPRPWAAISDFRFTFRRGKFSFCAAKSMDDLSLAFRNLHKLHNSRSSVNYLDVAAWTCAWKVFSRSLFKLIF